MVEIKKNYTPITRPKSSPLTQEDGAKIHEKIGEMNILMTTVVIILLVMVASLVIDSFHINSVTYKEYSNKNDVLIQLQETNKNLLLEMQALMSDNERISTTTSPLK